VAFDYNRQMIWLRKGFVYLLSIVLLVCLLGLAGVTGVSRNLSHPDKLENWLTASKIYDHLTAAVLNQSQKSGNDNSGSGSVSLSDPAVQQAAQTAFSPVLLQDSVNSFLNSNYAWLAGKTATPEFNIDLSSAKQNFAKLVGQAAATHLAALPVCTPAQLAQISIPVDSLSITCRPVTLSPQAENARITQSVNGSSDFLSNPVITASSVNQTQKSSPSQPYYQKLSWAPKAYQLSLKLPWILGALVLLSTLGIVFIAPEKRRGVRRVGIVLMEAGIILIIEKLVADALIKKLENRAVHGNSLASQLQQPISDLLHRIEIQLVQNYLWFGISFLLIALVIFVILFKTRQQRAAKPKTPKASFDDTATTPQTDARNIRLAPRYRQPSEDTTDLQPMAPKPTPAGTPPPIGKNPPRPKPPRLIQ